MPKKHLEIPLTGKLMLSEPSTIGTNFRTLTNMRYTDATIQGIAGNTKINPVPMVTNLKTRNTFHFKKTQPSESHILAQIYDTALSTSGVFDNLTPIPNTGHFNELMTLDVAPATPWSVGDTITGLTSNKTCVIVEWLTSTTYVIRSRSGAFTLDETLTNGSVTANQGATRPIFSLRPRWTDSSGAGRGYFSDAPDGKVVYCNGVDTLIWGGRETKIGAFITSTAAVGDDGVFTGAQDLTDKVSNTKTDATNLVTLNDGRSDYIFVVGSPTPLHGIKMYVATANTSASTMTGTTWINDSWDALTLVDDTDTGPTLGRTGWITFGTPASTPRFLEGYYLYWYQFTISNGSAVISHVTMDAPFNPIIDIWDGVYRDISAFYVRTTHRKDYALNVYKDDYEHDIPDTYVDIGVLATFSEPNYCLEIGFTEKMTGLQFRIIPEYSNTTAGTVVGVDFWNGGSYVSVGTVSDGTSENSISMANSGVMTWNNLSLDSEVKYTSLQSVVVGDITDTSTPLYFYRVRFNKNISETRVNYVGGINASKSLTNYKFPVFAQGRILLCGDMSEDKFKIVVSAKNMPHVYNGGDSVDIYLGDEGELNAGIELFSPIGSNLYSLILMFKDTETWIIAGQDINTWSNNIFCLSKYIGCPAPLTLKSVNLATELGQGVNRSLAIWQGSNGIYMSDGRAPIPIHGDIKEYFDMNDSRCIKASEVGNSTAFMDYSKQEYHWLFASGTSGTAKELVYDVHRNKWYEISRGMALTCGCEVTDVEGNQYTYGFIDTGYMERLENGTDFDGNDIIHTFQFGDFAPLGLSFITQLDHLKLLTVAKTTTSANVTCSHYADTLSSSSDYVMSPAKTGYRIANPAFDSKLQGEPYHSLKFTITTDNETIGFEPIAVVATFHQLQEE